MQHNTGLSNFGVKKLVSTLNQVVSSRIVEKNFLPKFDQLIKKLESHFTKTLIKVATDKGTNQVYKLHWDKELLSHSLQRLKSSLSASS